jgi:hypothetical protein
MQILTIIVFLPGIIWESITPIPAVTYFQYSCLVAILFTCILIALYAGYRLLSTIHSITVETQLYYTLKLV